MASQAAIDVQVPTSLQGQSWLGQVSLTFNAPSAGVNNVNAGAATLSGPVGTFRRYTITIPSFVVTALNTHTYSDLTITVQLTVPSTSGAFLLDALTLTPGGGGGTGGAGGMGGGGGTAGGGTAGGGTAGGGSGGRGGAAGTGGTTGGTTGGAAGGSTGGLAGSGGATGGVAGSGGVAGGASGGGSAGSTGTATEEVIIDLPKNLQTSAVTLGAYGNGGGLVINDGTRVVEGSGGFANVTSARTTVATDLGVNTRVKDVYSTPNIFVRGSHIYGNVWTSAGLVPNPQQPSIIDGTVQHHVSLDPIRRLSWTVPFPTFTGDPTVVPQSGNLTLEPGGTRGITLLQDARLKLNRPGVYTLDGPFVMEPNSVLEVDNAGGQVELYIRKDFIFRGTIQKTDPRNNVLIAALGTGDQPIERRFNAILVAPRGNVQLATVTNGHQTSVYAKSILARPNTTITHTPFDPAGFCEEPRCHGLCPVATAIRQCQAGEPCSTEDDCVDDLTCQGGICVEPPDCASDPGACTPDCPCVPAGQPCLETDRCEGGLACANGTCSSLPTGSCAPTSVDDLNDCTLDGCFANGTIVHLQRVAGYPCTGGTCTEGAVCDLTGDFGGRGQPPNPSGSCSFGLVLGTNNGAFFGLPVETDVCWSELCELSPTAHCGGPSHLCGNCPWQGHPESSCNPSCAGKVCGDDPDDGCGGVCYLCEVGECGCSIDAECGLGKSCLTEGTAAFGCANGAGVCWPTACGDPGFRAANCGGPSSACGPCPQCNPQCDGRACGPDGCGGECGACATGEYCDDATDGTAQCRTRLSNVMGPIPPAAIDPSSYVTQAVGTLAGKYDVSHDGQARYRIPIVVAPGRGSMQPELALSYDSSGRTGPPLGMLGDGWSLEGIPLITRCPMTLAQDGIARGTGFLPPSPSPNDRFCLNGQRLRLVSGAYYGAPDSEYRTEMDSTVRVVVDEIEVGPVGGPSADEPAQFSLFLPDGRRIRLRHAGGPNIWLPVFSEAQDTSGNTLSHGWGFDFGSQATAGLAYDFYPTSISYAGHVDGTVPDSVVRFSYVDRPDTRERYRHGMLLVESRLLDKLQVSVAGNLVREYRFTYTTLSENGSSQLATIQECVPTLPSSTELTCKPPTVFEYDNRPAGLSDPVPLGFKPNSARDPSYDVKPEIGSPARLVGSRRSRSLENYRRFPGAGKGRQGAG